MTQQIHITDPEDPRVDVYRAQKDAWLRAQHRQSTQPETGDQPLTGTGYADGLFMAEGKLVLRQLVESRFAPESLLVISQRLGSIEAELTRVENDTPIYVVERDIMEAICGFDVHRGVLAASRRGEPLTVTQVVEQSEVLVILEDLSNHDNVGGIFRSAAALAGLERVGVLLSPRCCDPLYRKAIRVSMGWALRVPFATVEDWPGGLDRLRDSGWSTVALTPAAGSVPIGELGGLKKPAILIGAEGPGLSDPVLELAEFRVRIPIDDAVDSLNAGVSAAIALAQLGG